MDRYIAIGLSLCALLGCRAETYLHVDVHKLDTLGERPRSLQVLVAREGQAAAALPVLELPEPGTDAAFPPSQHFVLQLPEGLDAAAPLKVAIAAFAQPGARGCLLGTADKQVVPAEVSGTTFVDLEKLPSPYCGASSPVLLDASPRLSPLEGNVAVQLTGWGFHPGATTVRIGNQTATVLSISATRIVVRTPARAGFGLVPIVVANSNTEQHQRSDLLRYYTDQPTFEQPYTPSLSTGYAISDLVAAPLFPGAGAAVVWTNPYLGQLSILEFKSQPPAMQYLYSFPKLQPTPDTLKPMSLAPGDFDHDGDIDFAMAYDAPNPKEIEIFWNDGTGRNFPTSTKFALGLVNSRVIETIRSLKADDLNGDGYPDLIALVHLSTENIDHIVTYFNNQAKGFEFQDVVSAGGGEAYIAVGPSGRTNNPRPDIVSVTNDFLDPKGDNVRILLNSGMGKFSKDDGGGIDLPQICEKPAALRMSNLNGDAFADLVIACASSKSIITLFGRAGVVMPIKTTLELDADPTDVVVADVNGDDR